MLQEPISVEMPSPALRCGLEQSPEQSHQDALQVTWAVGTGAGDCLLPPGAAQAGAEPA